MTTREKAGATAVLLIIVLLGQLLPALSFLSNTPDSRYGFMVKEATTFHSVMTSPDLVLPMTISAAAGADAESSSSPDQENSALQQAKLAILQDVVVQLNLTRCEDQREIQKLQKKLDQVKAQLDKEQGKYRTLLESSASQARENESLWNQERQQLQSRHQAEVLDLKRQLARKAQQDQLRQELLKETTQQKLEWKESLEIATAAVTAAETREKALLIQLEDLETRYHQEAAQYKTELGELQKEWKAENRRLEKEIVRLSAELTETKSARDKETTTLLEQLEDRNAKLKEELKLAKSEIAFQKLQFSTQQQVAKEEWQEQRAKERRFYAEAMKLLQQETRPGFWRRIFRSVFGGGRGHTKGATTTTSSV